MRPGISFASSPRRIMKFVIEKSVEGGTGAGAGSGGRGRLGYLELERPSTGELVSYPTPMYFIHTLSGSIPHITSEVFHMLFGENQNDPSSPLPPIQLSVDTMFNYHDVVGPSGMNISKFVGLADCPTLLTVMNPLKTFEPGNNDKKGISIWSRNGRKTLDTKTFNQIVTDFQPTLFQCMNDYDVSSTTVGKRLKNSRSRSVEYLKETIQIQAIASQGKKNKARSQNDCSDNDSVINGHSNPNNLFASVEPAWFQATGTDGDSTLALMLENRDQIGGFVVKRNYDEPTDFVTCYKLISGKLPPEKVRYISGVCNLKEIIDLVLEGVDVFDTSVCTELTDSKKAIILPNLTRLNFPDKIKISNEDLPVRVDSDNSSPGDLTPEELAAGNNVQILDLKDKRYFDDFRPLSSDCSCYTCRRHTRSYIHHLHATNELLSYVLLQAHNLVTMDRFFCLLRYCLQHEDSVEKLSILAEAVSSNLADYDCELDQENEREVKNKSKIKEQKPVEPKIKSNAGMKRKEEVENERESIVKDQNSLQQQS